MSYTLEGSTGTWEIVVGLEVHAQIISKSKLFSGSATDFGAGPNTQVSLVDAAFPGMLPVLNEECVAQAVRTGLGMDAHINLVSRFDRKNYFYADLPQGYQISQFAHPIVGAGNVEIELSDGSTKTIGVTRLHIEQDAGKSLHDQDPSKTYIDLNRSGVALMEIVSEPDIRSPEEAGAYLRKLRQLCCAISAPATATWRKVPCVRTSNVSVRKHGEPFRTRCEVKNVNSIRFVTQAVEAEAIRQIGVWEDGGTVIQETRLYDPSPRRNPLHAQQGRRPRLPLFPRSRICSRWCWTKPGSRKLKSELPELPDAKRARFMQQYGLALRRFRRADRRAGDRRFLRGCSPRP